MSSAVIVEWDSHDATCKRPLLSSAQFACGEGYGPQALPHARSHGSSPRIEADWPAGAPARPSNGRSKRYWISPGLQTEPGSSLPLDPPDRATKADLAPGPWLSWGTADIESPLSNLDGSVPRGAGLGWSPGASRLEATSHKENACTACGGRPVGNSNAVRAPGVQKAVEQALEPTSWEVAYKACPAGKHLCCKGSI